MKRLATILLLFCTPVLAHDANDPELNRWFDRLSSGNGLFSLSDDLPISRRSPDARYRRSGSSPSRERNLD